MPDEDNEIPDAQPRDVAPESFETLVIGPPFAMASGCDLVEHNDGKAACGAVCRCDCGQMFRVNLLASEPSDCPNCGETFTTVCLVAPMGDREMVAAALATILGANGYRVAELESSDVDDDEPGDDEPGETPK